MTLEEAQAKILELQEELNTVKGEKETLTQTNNTLTEDLKKAREVNQKMLEKVVDHKEDKDDKDKEEPQKTLEEYAEGLNII